MGSFTSSTNAQGISCGITPSTADLNTVDDMTFMVYPNPTNNDFITIENFEPNSSFQILNNLGQVVKKGELTKTLNIIDLNQGTYTILFFKNSNFIGTTQLVVFK